MPYMFPLPNGQYVNVTDDTPPDVVEARLRKEAPQLFAGLEVEQPAPDYGLLEAFGKGVKRGTRQMASAFGDVIPAMAANALGADEYAKQQMDEAAASREAIQKEVPAQVPSYRDVDGVRSGAIYALEAAGEAVPSMLGALLPGGIAGSIAKRGVLAAAEKGALSLGAKELATLAAKKQMTGQLVGAYLGSYAQNAPEIFQNIYDRTGDMRPGVAMLASTVSAALDTVVPAKVLHGMNAPVRAEVVKQLLQKSGTHPVLAGLAKGLLAGAAEEGITEAAQEGVSIAAERFVEGNDSLWTSDEWHRVIDSGLKGAAGGAGFGALGGGAEAYRVKTEAERVDQPPPPAPFTGKQLGWMGEDDAGAADFGPVFTGGPTDGEPPAGGMREHELPDAENLRTFDMSQEAERAGAPLHQFGDVFPPPETKEAPATPSATRLGWIGEADEGAPAADFGSVVDMANQPEFYNTVNKFPAVVPPTTDFVGTDTGDVSASADEASAAALERQYRPRPLDIPTVSAPRPITLEDVAATGVAYPGRDRWFAENVVGKTQDELRQLVFNKPELLPTQGQELSEKQRAKNVKLNPRAQVISALLGKPLVAEDAPAQVGKAIAEAVPNRPGWLQSYADDLTTRVTPLLPNGSALKAALQVERTAIRRSKASDDAKQAKLAMVDAIQQKGNAYRQQMRKQPKQTPLKSQGDSTTTGHTADELNSRLDSIFGAGFMDKLFGTGRFHVGSAEQVGAATQEDTGNTRGMYDRRTGITHLIADNIPKALTDNQLRGLMLHEIAVHALRVGRDSDGWQFLMSELQRLHKLGNKDVVEAHERAAAAGTEDADLWEEVAAYLVQNKPKASITRRILTWFKDQVNKVLSAFGRDRLSLTPDDITAMAQSAFARAPRELSKAVVPGEGVIPSERAPIWYSQLKRVMEQQGETERSGNEWIQWLNGNLSKLGVKKVEVEASGITDFLALLGKKKTSAQELAAFVERNGPRVESRVLSATPADGPAPWSDYKSLHGGHLYGVLAVHYPHTAVTELPDGWIVEPAGHDADSGTVFFHVRDENGRYVPDTLATSRELAVQQATEKSSLLYQSPHYNGRVFSRKHAIPNLIATARVSDIEAASGETVLAAHELQSDWGADLIEQAKPETTLEVLQRRLDEAAAARDAAWEDFHTLIAPFVRDISTELALALEKVQHTDPNRYAKAKFESRFSGTAEDYAEKMLMPGDPTTTMRLVRQALTGFRTTLGEFRHAINDERYRRVRNALDNLEESTAYDDLLRAQDRYFDATNALDRYELDGPEQRNVAPPAPHVNDTRTWTALILKNMLRHAVDNGYNGIGWASGMDVHIMFPTAEDGSSTLPGMKKYYDEIAPSVARDVMKKLGGGEVTTIETKAGQRIHYIPLTDKLRDTVSRGMPLFSKAPAATARAKPLRSMTFDDDVAGATAPQAAASTMQKFGKTLQQASDTVLGPERTNALDGLLRGTASDVAKNATLGALPLHALADWIKTRAGRVVTEQTRALADAAARFLDLERLRNGAYKEADADVGAIYKATETWRRANPNKISAFNEVVFRGSDAKIDFRFGEPHYAERVAAAKSEDARAAAVEKLNAYRALKPLYDSLGKDGQATYAKMRATYDRLYYDVVEQIRHKVQSISGDGELATSVHNVFHRKLIESGGLEGYAPFLREGDYILKYDIREPGKEGTVPVVRFFKSKLERSRFIEGIEKVDPGLVQGSIQMPAKVSRETFRGAPPNSFMGQLMTVLSDNGVQGETLDEIMRLAVSLSPEGSLARMLQHRKGTRGYVEDAFWAFEKNALSLRKKALNLRFAADFSDTLRKVKDAEKLAGPDEVLVRHAQELEKRLQFAMNPTLPTWSHLARTATYAWTLGLNVSSAMIDMAAIPMVFYPYLLANYGSSATAALSDATKVFFGSGRTHRVESYLTAGLEGDALKEAKKAAGLTGRDISELKGYYSITNYDFSKITDPRIKRLETLAKIANDHGQVIRFSMYDDKDALQEGSTLAKVNAWQGLMMQLSERTRREIGMTAHYNLALDKIERATGRPATAAEQQQAARNAVDFIENTSGGLSSIASPRWSQSSLGSVAFLYKKYGLTMYYHQFKMLRELLASESDPATRAAAKRQFFTTMVTSALFAGVRGMPMVGIVAALWNAFKDEEDDDFNTMLSKNIGWGATGPINALLNTEVSARVSLTNLLVRDLPGNENRSTADIFALVLGGPAWGTADRVMRGVGLINQGNMERGLETLLPASVANVMKSVRYYAEGTTNLKGDPITKDVSFFNAVGQAIGFAPADYIAAQERATILKAGDDAMRAARGKLMQRLWIASRASDAEEVRSIMQDVQEFNKRYPYSAITGDTIMRSRSQHMRALKDMIYSRIPDASRRAFWLSQLREQGADDF
jgi:hypothetical protein